jgi:hypothetical protein
LKNHKADRSDGQQASPNSNDGNSFPVAAGVKLLQGPCLFFVGGDCHVADGFFSVRNAYARKGRFFYAALSTSLGGYNSQ